MRYQRNGRRRSIVICTLDHETGELSPIGGYARGAVRSIRREFAQRTRIFAIAVVPAALVAGMVCAFIAGVGPFADGAQASGTQANTAGAGVSHRPHRVAVEVEAAASRPPRPAAETGVAGSGTAGETLAVVPAPRIEVVRTGTRLVTERTAEGFILRQVDVYETRVVPAAAPWRGPAGPVNLNTATADELDHLPGIGPVLTAQIIAARPFRSVGDLYRVPGIGPKRYAEIAPLVTVD